MLQREIPDRVTLAAARAARARGALVLLDAGGVDDPIPTELLSAVDYVMPNESELARQTHMPADTDDLAYAAAEALAGAGAARVVEFVARRNRRVDAAGDDAPLRRRVTDRLFAPVCVHTRRSFIVDTAARYRVSSFT